MSSEMTMIDGDLDDLDDAVYANGLDDANGNLKEFSDNSKLNAKRLIEAYWEEKRLRRELDDF
jgi:hypothetical protein